MMWNQRDTVTLRARTVPRKKQFVLAWCVYAALELENKEAIALYDTRVHKALSKLLHLSQIRIYGVVPEDEWKSKVEARASLPLKNARKVYMRASILLIGPRPASEQVARSLATCQLYLQDAPPGLTSYPYVNPQSLEIPQMPVMENVFSSLEPFSYIDYGIEIDPPLAGRTREADNLFADVADFFDEFTSHEFLPQAITDIRIKTPLLRCSGSFSGQASELTVLQSSESRSRLYRGQRAHERIF